MTFCFEYLISWQFYYFCRYHAAVILYPLTGVILSNGIIDINHQCNYTMSLSYWYGLRFYTPFFFNITMRQLSFILASLFMMELLSSCLIYSVINFKIGKKWYFLQYIFVKIKKDNLICIFYYFLLLSLKAKKCKFLHLVTKFLKRYSLPKSQCKN